MQSRVCDGDDGDVCAIGTCDTSRRVKADGGRTRTRAGLTETLCETYSTESTTIPAAGKHYTALHE